METEVLLEVKPKYIMWLQVLLNVSMVLLCLLLFLILFIPFFVGILIDTIFTANVGPIGAFICLLLLIFAILTALTLYITRKNYEATNYKLYRDRIEFEEGFINHKYTTIKMQDIKEIHLEQNFFQRMAQLGTIRFVTAANLGVSTGVCFKDIENSSLIYAKVKQIHENI